MAFGIHIMGGNGLIPLAFMTAFHSYCVLFVLDELSRIQGSAALHRVVVSFFAKYRTPPIIRFHHDVLPFCFVSIKVRVNKSVHTFLIFSLASSSCRKPTKFASHKSCNRIESPMICNVHIK
jgi:hypothetical protein